MQQPAVEEVRRIAETAAKQNSTKRPVESDLSDPVLPIVTVVEAEQTSVERSATKQQDLKSVALDEPARVPLPEHTSEEIAFKPESVTGWHSLEQDEGSVERTTAEIYDEPDIPQKPVIEVISSETALGAAMDVAELDSESIYLIHVDLVHALQEFNLAEQTDLAPESITAEQDDQETYLSAENQTQLPVFTDYLEKVEMPDSLDPVDIFSDVQEKPLEEVLAVFGKTVAENPDSAAGDFEELLNAVEDLQAHLDEIGYDENNRELSITTETTAKLLRLVRLLGYENPHKVIVEHVRAYGLVFVWQASEYISRTLQQAEQNSIATRKLSSQKNPDNPSSTLATFVLALAGVFYFKSATVKFREDYF